MGWQEIYQSKITSADEAVRCVNSGDRVLLAGNCGIPQELLAALVRRLPELYEVELCQAHSLGERTLYTEPGMESHMRVNTMFISQQTRQAVNEGRADFTPVLLSEFPLLFKRNHLRLDVALVHLSPPDEHGFCSYGIDVGLAKAPAESARIVIAEVNQQMPRTLGDSFIHVNRLTHVVPVNYPLVEFTMDQPEDSQLAERIARRVADLIPDGATLQIGIGAIPNAVLRFVFHRKDLGIHSEIFSDNIIDLVEAGVITNARKTLHQGKVVAGFILGTQRLYEYVHNNPIIELHPTEHVNDPFVIAQNYRQVAINSAIEIDLTGQVCADSIGTSLYSGAGGQLDFMYGAARSEGGVPIIALASADGDEATSHSVPTLRTGSGVVTTRNHVHYVVTEFGVTQLYGKTVRQRARELINIAHPKFRDELTRAAQELRYLS